MEYLFAGWNKFKKKLDSSRQILLAFDYDGTLTPIVEKPELAKLSPAVKNSLRVLSKEPFFSLVIISGRPLAEIKRLVGLKNIIYAGNHGLEIEGPKIKFVNTGGLKTKQLMRVLFKLLSKKLMPIKGLRVENKGLSLSIHYRLVKIKSDLDRLETLLYGIIKPWQTKKKIKLTFGKKVYEVRPPVRWDKGKAINYLLGQKSQFKFKPLVIALGDDRTDEDMFKVVKNKGISVFVGSPRISSSARYYLSNVAEVKNFLGRLIRETKKL